MNWLTRAGTLALLSTITLSATGSASSPQFAVTYLGHLGGNESHSRDINAWGDVVGDSETATGDTHAFIWMDATVGMIDLGALPRHRTSLANGINDFRQVVGESRESDGDPRAFLWEDGTMLDLGTLGGPTSVAHAINNAGQVVGQAITSGGQNHASLWQNGAIQDLGTLGGTYSIANDINESGQVVGWSYWGPGPRDQHAFLWEDGEMQDLGTLGGAESEAVAINDEGQIIGSSRTSDGFMHVFLWEDGVMTDIGLLGSGNLAPHEKDINANEVVVGITGRQGIGGYQPFIWEMGVLQYLDDLITGAPTCDLTSAEGINRSTQIASYCRNIYTSEHQAVVLTPIQ